MDILSAPKLRLPQFYFMTHDRWDQALFLHWRVPPELELFLRDDAAPFQLERYNGSAWIGLVLLTEVNVGPSIFRSRLTCVTHHGINVRTYVQNPSENNGDDNPQNSTAVNGEHGIHFSSLECNDEFTAYGANYFGMPYRMATMTRRTSCPEGIDENNKGGDDTQKKILSSTVTYHMESERWKSARPSLLRVLFRTLPIPRFAFLGSDKSPIQNSADASTKSNGDIVAPSTPKSRTPSGFSVRCTWKVRDDNDSGKDSFAKWAIERYFVYTQKYGISWRGQVEHEPWPSVRAVDLQQFCLDHVETYEPAAMRPILEYMKTQPPDSALFSPGVGPVSFRMLHPV